MRRRGARRGGQQRHAAQRRDAGGGGDLLQRAEKLLECRPGQAQHRGAPHTGRQGGLRRFAAGSQGGSAQGVAAGQGGWPGAASLRAAEGA